MNGLIQVTENEFRYYMRDRNFNINEILNTIQFIIRGSVIGVVIFNNSDTNNSKFYLKDE